MKSNNKIAFTVIANFVLGAGASQILHAQTKPLAYTLAEIAVNDEDGYKKNFLRRLSVSRTKF